MPDLLVVEEEHWGLDEQMQYLKEYTNRGWRLLAATPLVNLPTHQSMVEGGYKIKEKWRYIFQRSSMYHWPNLPEEE